MLFKTQVINTIDMKNKFKYILLSFCTLFFIGCSSSSNDELPSDIADVIAIPGKGYITLKWDFPDDGSILYTKVSYYDHLFKKDMWRLSSTDSIRIPDTRHKYGEYNFTLQPYSHTETPGNSLSITAVSDKAPSTEVANLIKLTEEQLSTNAQEPSEGPIKHLIDGKTDTFFHTQWSAPVPAGPHWLQVDLNEPIQRYRIHYSPRNNANNKPTDFDLLGSMDGEEWFLIKNYTKEKDNLPVGAKAEYKSPTFLSEKPFKHLRYSVNKTNTGSIFWTMSEFSIYSVEFTDPEAPDESEVPVEPNEE